MAEKIRIGIVGATVTQGGSGWGANSHIPALRALPDFEIKAVCTAHEETAQASAAAFGAELAFHDMDAMAAHPDVDLIVVCVRVPWHKDLVMAGLRAGKPVFCEWPLGANLAEAEEMAAFARERSLQTIVGLQGRSDPAVRHAHDLIAQGAIGEVLTANLSVMGGAVYERAAGRLWQRDRATARTPSPSRVATASMPCARSSASSRRSPRASRPASRSGWTPTPTSPCPSMRRMRSASPVDWSAAPRYPCRSPRCR